MPRQLFDSQRAKEAGKRSGAARRKAKRSQLTLADVEAQLPPMDTPEHVKGRLEVLTNWAVCGLVSPGILQAGVSACRVWFLVNDLQLDRERTHQLEQQLQALQAQLDARPLRRA